MARPRTGTRYLVEPIAADRDGRSLSGRALAAALSAARFSVGETEFSNRAAAERAAEALSERSPDGLRVVWQVRLAHRLA